MIIYLIKMAMCIGAFLSPFYRSASLIRGSERECASALINRQRAGQS